VSLSRGRFLALCGAGGWALLTPGAGLSLDRLLTAAPDPDIWSFRSEPTFTPPVLTVTTPANGVAPGYLFTGTVTGPGQRGPAILDNAGNIVWFEPSSGAVINLRPQVYGDEPVLTWWYGAVNNGISAGKVTLMNASYETIATVAGGNGFQADLHEFLLTPQKTALLTAYNTISADLTPVGGPANGTLIDSIVLEVDVATGKVLFEWHSAEHVPTTDSYAALAAPFDYFHINSIDVDLDNNLIVSARNTSTVYKLDRKTGTVIWRLGGKSSDFAMAPEAVFMWQHDARMHPDRTLTIFDDGPSPTSQQSRAIRLGVDAAGKQAILLEQFRHTDPLQAVALGNAQVLHGGAVLVGWGSQPYISEYGPDGTLRFDSHLPAGAENYRTIRSPWVGEPKTKPKIAVARNNGRAQIYASWNGSTETVAWRVLAGPTRKALTLAKTAPRTGFETHIALASRPAFVAVQAVDSKKRVLATSATHAT
jgi:hypothetical protein